MMTISAVCRTWCLLCLVYVALTVSATGLSTPSSHHNDVTSAYPTLPITSLFEFNNSLYNEAASKDFPLKKITFTRVLFLCEYLYSAIHGSYEGLTDAVISYRNLSITVISDESFFSVCMPFLKHYKSIRCAKKPFITICISGGLVFLHDHGCSKPSPDDAYFDHLLATTLLEKDEPCFEAVCNGELRAVRREIEGYTVHLFSPVSLHSGCHKYLLPYYPSNAGSTRTLFRNVHWTSCFPGYEVVWSRDAGRSDKVINTWSYLPHPCRIMQQFVAAMMGVVVVSGVTGNLIVIMAYVLKEHHRDHTGMLYVSLATAELLLCCLVMVPGLHAHLSVMRGIPTEEHDSGSVASSTSNQLLLNVGMEKVEGGFHTISAHVMNIGCVVSLSSVLILSLDKYLAISGRSLQEELTICRIRGFMAASWFFGVLVSIALVYSNGAFWYSFYKLSLSIPPGGIGMILTAVVVILGMVKGATVALSFINVWKSKTSQGIHRHTLLIAVLHFVSSVAAGLAFLLPLTTNVSPYLEGTRFLCWWVFLSSASWHPWVLGISYRHFHEALLALTARCRLSWLRRLIGTAVILPMTPSPPLSPRPPPRPRPKLAPGRRRTFLPGVRYYK